MELNYQLLPIHMQVSGIYTLEEDTRLLRFIERFENEYIISAVYIQRFNVINPKLFPVNIRFYSVKKQPGQVV